MTETTWQRLRRLTDVRRDELGLTLAQVNAAGGPSPKWIQKLYTATGGPNSRHRRALGHLDGALLWEHGTAWKIAAGEITQAPQSPESDAAAAFGAIVSEALRKLPAGERARAMAKVLAVLDEAPNVGPGPTTNRWDAASRARFPGANVGA